MPDCVSADHECAWWPVLKGYKGEFREDDHPRDDDGKFGSGGGSSESSESGSGTGTDSAADPDPNRPSRKENRKEGAKPPALAEKKKPPAPKGQSKAPKNAAGRPTTGYSANGMTNTAFGDMVEKVSSKLGLRNILPEGKRSNQNVEEEGSSIDTEWDHSGYAFEIKACAVEAQEYKCAAKRSELDDKKRYAEKHDLKPGVVIIVTDVEQGKAWAYWKEGLDKGGKLNPEKLDDWNYMGEIDVDKPAAKDKKE